MVLPPLGIFVKPTLVGDTPLYALLGYLRSVSASFTLALGMHQGGDSVDAYVGLHVGLFPGRTEK